MARNNVRIRNVRNVWHIRNVRNMLGHRLFGTFGHRTKSSVRCPSTYDAQRTMSNIQCPTCNVQHTMPDINGIICEVQCPAYDVHRTMSNIRCPTSDVQRTMSDMMSNIRCPTYSWDMCELVSPWLAKHVEDNGGLSCSLPVESIRQVAVKQQTGSYVMGTSEAVPASQPECKTQ